MDPEQAQTARAFDSYKDTYSTAVDDAVSFTGLKSDFFTRVKADYIVDICKSHFKSINQISALDVGCGVGNYHPILAPQMASLTGVDVSGECVNTARKRNQGISYDAYDGETLPYDNDTFDLVFTICVIHHVPVGQWDRFASEMYRVLRPGGLALIFEHNPRNPLTMRAVNSCPFDEDAVLLGNSTATSLLVKAGFSQTESRFILSIPPLTNWLRQLDKLFGKIPFGAQYYVAAVK
ncbi:class I SAM-dependent methyltransferase [Ancylobacter radicis]|uniref:Class I SAM-dependent methyltransferase n=1 Tax=Ancylobacter radicis TaxID=2836179 RepID=A0ABS5R9J1_9HYPH|nr:class I SAM-dependent methyltransferase [Ancylobacter radicis]MBS9478339.1 class I SAM-dependent methyltransferase [Ancylobacter radicis]